MKNTILAILVFPSIAFAQNAGIPSDSLDLLAKLKEYETTERAKLEQQISEKRKAVEQVLESHLDRETKAGNLDRALQLRKAIEQLAATPLLPETSSIADPKPEEPSDSLTLEGTTWTGISGKLDGAKVEFHGSGRMTVSVPTAPRPWTSWRYRVDGADVFITPSEEEETEIRISRKNTRIEVPTWGEIERDETPEGEQAEALKP